MEYIVVINPGSHVEHIESFENKEAALLRHDECHGSILARVLSIRSATKSNICPKCGSVCDVFNVCWDCDVADWQ